MATFTRIVDLEEKITPELDGKRIPVEISQQILCAIANIEYGSVEVVIHDGKVVQIECRKKIRVDRNEPARRGVML
ncbi:MAG: YezD family protein [Pseudomonadota bacterium]|nr:YezD family protein [Pseudomonadota bacterium]